MRKSTVLVSLLLSLFHSAFAQSSLDQTINPYFDLVRPNYKGDLAYETVAFVSKYWRVAGNTGFNETVYRIAEKLENAGYLLEGNSNPDSRFTYRIEKRTMDRPTWEPLAASLTISGEEKPLLDFSTNSNMIYLNSSSTPSEGIKAELVYIASKEDLKTANFKGKIIFSDVLSYRNLQSAVSEKGALGIMTYDNPDYLQPEKNQTSIQFRSMRYEKGKENWAIALSFVAKERLKAALARGSKEVTVKIETKHYDSEELTIIANVRGSKSPLESLVFSAHIQEPGANDNASGVGAQLEMATLTANLIQNEKLDLDRTLTFLWGDEIISTRRYIQEKERRENEIKWGISLDMVGENTEITGGTFLIEKMPDPSAIWTRGKDQHTEWGGRPMKVAELKPHYLNDFILTVFQNQGRHANWIVETNPFEGGSDHTPFLNANIPGLLLWHFTDQFYHTDNDRLDKVSQETLKNVASGALASAYTLLNADAHLADQLIEMLLEKASKRLMIEIELSKKAIAAGGFKEDEQLILDTWIEYYEKSLDTVEDLVPADDVATLKKITTAKTAIKSQVRQFQL